MRVMHFSSDIHTVTYLSKNMEFAGWTLSAPLRLLRGAGVSARMLLILLEKEAIMLN